MFTILSTCKGGGYRYCRTDPPHPRRNSKGLYPLHIVIVKNRIGRLLRPGEEVHHDNEDKSDDSPENLFLTTKGTHSRYHAYLRAKPLDQVVCPNCSETFAILPSVLRTRRDRNPSAIQAATSSVHDPALQAGTHSHRV